MKSVKVNLMLMHLKHFLNVSENLSNTMQVRKARNISCFVMLFMFAFPLAHDTSLKTCTLSSQMHV